MNEMQIELNVPYPPAKADSVNLYYASLLTNDLAGPISELSAVMDYTFQSLVTKDQQISALVAGISKIEMHHLHMIGELIVSLGGHPRYAVQNGCEKIFWNAQLIGYGTNPRDFFRDNIANEKAAIANYRARIEQVADNGVRAVIERVIKDEEHHIDLYGAALAQLNEA